MFVVPPTLRLFVLSLGIVFAAYPGFFLGTAFPMTQGAGELADTAAAEINFIPCLSQWRRELVVHHNLLWSSLRSFGLPVLADTLQAAPLFPLTLVLIWLPESLYWNVFTVFKLVLTLFGCLLLARDVLRFRFFSSLAFSLSFGLGFYFLNRLNHPFTNAHLAGVWYLYFLFAASISARARISGLAVAVFAVATCGFPEGSAAVAVLTLLLFFPRWAVRDRAAFWGGRAWFWQAALAHLLGFSVSSWQLLPFLELLGQTVREYRTQHGLAQLGSFDFLVAWVARFGVVKNPPNIPHYFGLISLTLFLGGLCSLVKKRGPWDFAALACFAFFILKFFPVSPLFNEWVGSLPLLRQSWIVIYFYAIPLWFFAYCAGRGAEGWFYEAGGKRALLVCSGLVVAGLAAFNASQVAVWEWRRAIVAGMAWLAFLGVLTIFSRNTPSHLSRRVLLLVCSLLFIEFLTLRSSFLKSTPVFDLERRLGHRVAGNLKAAGSELWEFRSRHSAESWISAGIATVDGGYALLPARTLALRESLFAFDPGPLYPVQRERQALSWQRLSVNLDLGGNLLVPAALPRAYQPKGCIPVSSVDEGKVRLQDASSFGVLLLESVGPARDFCLPKANASIRAIGIQADVGSKVQLRPVQGPAWVVLQDTFYPGWSARDQRTGETLEIFPANVAFRAVYLKDAREYDVVFQYYPAWFWPCVLLTCFAGFGLMLVGVHPRFERTKKNGTL